MVNPLKKQSDFSRLMGYAGGHRFFTYASWALSAISALVALVPFLYIWMILRDVLEAAEKYAADPDSMAFNCCFLGGVAKFVMDGHTITGLDAQGQKVFSHTYRLLDEENENGFIFYQSEDENAGEFTYFAFSPDTMETTYHLEFRYAESLDDLQSWFEGNYAYWNAAAIAENYDMETMQNVIALFAAENLSSAE